jgi:hypothetical protein
MLRVRAIASALALSTLVIGLVTAAPAAAATDLTVTLPDDGSTTEITTTDPAQTVYARFNAARGQHLVLFCDTTTDIGLPGAKVVDSANKIVRLGPVDCFRHIMPEPAIEAQTVPTDGPLTLVLPPYKGKTFSVKVSYRVFDDVHTHAALDGGPTAFAPTLKGQDSFVSFEGKAGDRVYAACTSPLADRGVSAWLLDASGNVVLNEDSARTYGYCRQGELFYRTPALPADGTYTVQLDNTWLTDLSATLSLHKTLPTVTVAAPTDGTPFTLTTTGQGQNAKAVFSLGANEHALITCAQRAESPKWTQTLLHAPPTQYVPAESRTCWNATTAAGTTLMDSEWNWTEGPHTLEIDPHDADTGSFDLRVYKVRDPIAGTSGMDRPVSVTTTQPGQNAKVIFWADEGDEVSGTCQLAGGTARTTVYSPSGAVIATGTCATALMSVTTMPETGNYRAIIDWPGLGTNTATATFHRN